MPKQVWKVEYLHKPKLKGDTGPRSGVLQIRQELARNGKEASALALDMLGSRASKVLSVVRGPAESAG